MKTTFSPGRLCHGVRWTTVAFEDTTAFAGMGMRRDGGESSTISTSRMSSAGYDGSRMTVSRCSTNSGRLFVGTMIDRLGSACTFACGPRRPWATAGSARMTANAAIIAMPSVACRLM